MEKIVNGVKYWIIEGRKWCCSLVLSGRPTLEKNDGIIHEEYVCKSCEIIVY
jgi:hypothetical protein